MKILTEELWHDYFWSQNVGIQFENLVEELLQLRYPVGSRNSKWERTKKSWDGKKDFYQRFYSDDGMKTRWVECKAHRDTIDINVLAPTLIMSTLRDADEVIFFSYSRLNREAVKSLQEFAETHKKTVKLYDGEKLERLILKSKEDSRFQFYTFFPKFEHKAALVHDKDGSIACSAHVFVHRHNISYNINQLQDVDFRVNELFCLRVDLENHSLEKRDVELRIDLKENEAYHYIDLENRETLLSKTCVLQGGEVSSINVTMKVTKYKKQIPLPVIRVFQGEDEIYKINEEIRCRWLLETPFLGNINLLDHLEHMHKQMYYTVSVVSGVGGVGKTRFMREIQGRRYLAGGESIWFDGAQKYAHASEWVRRLLSKLYALPMVVIDDYSNQNLHDMEHRIIADILYDSSFDFSDRNIEKVACLILSGLRRKNTLLIIDNVQDFDDVTSKVINGLLNFIPDYASSHIVLCFNTDLLPLNETASNLHVRLGMLCKDNKLNYKKIDVTGLSPNKSKLFIRHCFAENIDLGNLTKHEYDDALDKIAGAGGGNPLYFEQLLLHLRDLGVISDASEYFYISDNYKLHSALSSLPDDAKKIIERRWNQIRASKKPQIEEMEKILRFQTFFSVIPLSFIRFFGLDDDSIDFLVNSGFLRKDEALKFYHPSVAMFFRGQYPDITQSEKTMCAQAFIENNCKDGFEANYYICALEAHQPEKNLIYKAIDEFISEKVPQPLLLQYGKSLFSAIERYGGIDSFSIEAICGFFTDYSYKLKSLLPLCEALAHYKQIHENFFKPFPAFRECGEMYMKFMKEYLNALLTERKTVETMELGRYLLNELDKVRFHSPDGYAQAKGMIYNRLYIAQNRMETPGTESMVSYTAKKYLEDSRDISYQISNSNLIIQNEIDIGNMYYYYGGEPEIAASHWLKAFAEWQANSGIVAGWKGGVYYHKALASMLSHDFQVVSESIEHVEQYYWRTLSNPFFYVKSLVLKSMLSMVQKKNFAHIFSELNESENACMRAGLKPIFPICSHLRAIAYHTLTNDWQSAVKYYKKALSQYIDMCQQPREEEQRADMLQIIAAYLRDLSGASYENSHIQGIKSSNVSAKLHKILEASDHAWALKRDEILNIRTMFYFNGIHYPCV